MGIKKPIVSKKDKLLKTGGWESQSKHLHKEVKDHKNLQVDRNKTTTETLNYGTQSGTIR